MAYRTENRAGRAACGLWVYVFLGLPALSVLPPSPAQAQKRPVALLAIATSDERGKNRVLGEDDHYVFERELRDQFARKDAPDEIFAIARTQPIWLNAPDGPAADLEVLIYGKEGELRWFANHSKAYYFARKLTAEDIGSIRKFVVANKVDELGAFAHPDIVGGTAYVYLHLTAGCGRRVCIQNPPESSDAAKELKRYPPGNPAWQYTKLVEFFERLKDPDKVRVHYCFSAPAPKGFDIVYADPENEVRAVWKQGKDLCVAVNKFGYSDDDAQFRKLVGGKLGATVANPKLAEEGCSSPDGRWLLKLDKNEDLECYDSLKKVSVPIADEQTRRKYLPMHFVEARQAFLVVRLWVSPLDLKAEPYPRDYRLLDPATGRSWPLDPAHEMPVRYGDGEASTWAIEPWSQPLPRRMQAVKGQPNVVWAASPTSYIDAPSRVGHYDTKRFEWLGRQLIPFFQLRTKDIWVDEDGQKIYAIYEGHLLAFPLDKHIDAQSEAIRTSDKIMAARDRAFLELRAKHFDAAIAAYSEAVALDPKDPESFALRAHAYHEKGDLAKAIADAGEVIRRDPDTPKAFWDRAQFYLEKGDFDRAIADYTEAIRLNPTFSYSYCVRGVAYSEKGDLNKAIADYTKAIGLGKSTAAHFHRARAYLKLGQADKAAADFDVVLEERPSYITDEDLEHVRGLDQWTSLSLGPEISDAGLKHLQGLKQLRWLDLAKTKITDAGLKYIEGLTQLETLDLSDTRITDAGLKHLRGLGRPHRLNLAGTKVTDAGVKELEKALPSLDSDRRRGGGDSPFGD